MAAILLCLLSLMVSANAKYTHLQWSKCGATLKSNPPLSLGSVGVTPVPIVIPGDINLSINGSLTRSISSSSLTISLKRKTFLLDIPIPCISHVGSCTYNDICTMVDDMVTQNWAGIMGGIGTQIKAMLAKSGVTYNACPQPAQALSIKSYSLHIPEMPKILSWFAAGDYHAHIEVNENSSGEQILCLDADLTVDHACSGFGCIFG
ncbi:ganglioside GM2 activator-like [Mytilus trossulus]|uniref:ganglioside GM2 activator-like n=1 Tax=Mytilus trossulus TaxID=6551 RepID=UPI003005FF76